ncbi:MAG: GNAT family N-acetyltransferase [Flavisolibacter sp.]
MIRDATLSDYPELHRIRMAVKENILSDPDRITRSDYETYLTHKGRGWLYTINSKIVGFVIIDLEDFNVWALFVDPLFEKKGIGRQLHDFMLEWYFKQYETTLWLGTAPGTRAESFYRKAGWLDQGLQDNGEIRFEMPREH